MTMLPTSRNEARYRGFEKYRSEAHRQCGNRVYWTETGKCAACYPDAFMRTPRTPKPRGQTDTALVQTVLCLNEAGLLTGEIADRLNLDGKRNRRGEEFTACQIAGIIGWAGQSVKVRMPKSRKNDVHDDSAPATAQSGCWNFSGDNLRLNELDKPLGTIPGLDDLTLKQQVEKHYENHHHRRLGTVHPAWQGRRDGGGGHRQGHRP